MVRGTVMRFLAIVLPALLGGALVWFFAPTFLGPQPVPVNPDLPSFSQITDEDLQKKPAKKTTMMSGEKRRSRAEQLLGKQFKYVTGNDIRSADWFSALEPQQLERAMDECFILSEQDLAMKHAAALRGDDEDAFPAINREDSAETVAQLMGSPNMTQLRICKNVFVAYWAKHGEKFEF